MTPSVNEVSQEPTPEQLDAARYQWLKARYLAADFAYGDPSETVCALIFEAPDDILVSADLDKTIDEARASGEKT